VAARAQHPRHVHGRVAAAVRAGWLRGPVGGGGVQCRLPHRGALARALRIAARPAALASCVARTRLGRGTQVSLGGTARKGQHQGPPPS